MKPKPSPVPPSQPRPVVKYGHANGRRVRPVPAALTTKSLKPEDVRALLQLTAKGKG